MNENIEPLSESEKTLNKIDARDKAVRLIEVFVLLIAVTFSIVSGLYYQKQTQAARAANAVRQDEQKAFLKCIILLKYDAPPEAFNTRKGAEKVLDDCANKTRD